MNRYVLNKPTLILLYGFPGSGKTFFARQFSEHLGAVHLHSDKVRHELFEEPRYDSEETDIINHILLYMAEEFLRVGVSVVFDADASRSAQRRLFREVAHATKAYPMLVWLQIDVESAFARIVKRDHRKTDDKYTPDMDRNSFEDAIGRMQNPTPVEDYAVISGKHNFQTQQNAVIKRLYDYGLLSAQSAQSNMVKPELVNLIPQNLGGRVDSTRRNISIR